MKTLVLLFCVLVLEVHCMKRYDGYQVLQVVPRNDNQVQYLWNLLHSHPELDFWLEPTAPGKPVDILVGPHQLDLVNTAMKTQSLPVAVVDHNVQKEIDEYFERQKNKPENMDYDYNDYNRYEDYMTEIDALASDCPSDVTCTVTVIGQTSEGRDIKLLHIDTQAPADFWIDACIHAREWLACATVMKIVDNMIRNTDNETANAVLRSYNWHIVPMYNGDGYAHTFEGDRFWRKSRNTNEGSSCLGTDLNRNHDYAWNTLGSSSEPCSDLYHGSSASSEVETQTIEAAGSAIGDTLEVWLSFHTYGWYWLVPYGDCTDPPNVESVQAVADATCNAIEANDYDDENASWDCGNSCRTLYATGGTTADWAMGNAGVEYSYTPELRGPGFNPPASEIEPSFFEIWDGLVAKIATIAELKGRKFM